MMEDSSQKKFWGQLMVSFVHLIFIIINKHNEHTFCISVFARKDWNDVKLFCQTYFSIVGILCLLQLLLLLLLLLSLLRNSSIKLKTCVSKDWISHKVCNFKDVIDLSGRMQLNFDVLINNACFNFPETNDTQLTQLCAISLSIHFIYSFKKKILSCFVSLKSILYNLFPYKGKYSHTFTCYGNASGL